MGTEFAGGVLLGISTGVLLATVLWYYYFWAKMKREMPK